MDKEIEKIKTLASQILNIQRAKFDIEENIYGEDFIFLTCSIRVEKPDRDKAEELKGKLNSAIRMILVHEEKELKSLLKSLE